jgi:drug/metabolite transporter (DMT)-like permease
MFSRGDLVVLGSALCFAAQILVTGCIHHSHPLEFSLVQLATVTILSGLGTLGSAPPQFTPLSIVAIAFCAIFATSLAIFVQSGVKPKPWLSLWR